jgi:hypothetical protein
MSEDDPRSLIWASAFGAGLSREPNPQPVSAQPGFHPTQGGGIPGPRGLSTTWCPDSMMGFRTAKSTIIPAVFDLAPNRQITANWQIRRHAPAVEK